MPHRLINLSRLQIITLGVAALSAGAIIIGEIYGSWWLIPPGIVGVVVGVCLAGVE
jgi:hypothetical protein